MNNSNDRKIFYLGFSQIYKEGMRMRANPQEKEGEKSRVECGKKRNRQNNNNSSLNFYYVI